MSSDRARIVLIGDGPTSESALRSLAYHFNVVMVLRNLDPADTNIDSVATLANELGVPLLPAPDIRVLEERLSGTDPDLVVVSSYGRILPPRVVDRYPFINVHYAPLPAYRGRANVNWALINGEPDVGITIHSIVAGLDAGPILAQRRLPIGDRDTVTDLYARLNELQSQMLPEAVRSRLRGDAGVPQDVSKATYCCGRTSDDGLIDWDAGTQTIDRLIRALTDPYPGAQTFCGTVRIIIDEAIPVIDAPDYVGRVPGRVVRVDRSSGDVEVLTGDGVLRIRSMRVDGEVRRPADVISSASYTLGLFPLEFLRSAGLVP